MAFVPVPDTAECNVIGMLFGQIVENTLYFATEGGWLPSSIIQLAASVGEWAVGSLCAKLSHDYTYLRTEAKDISAPGMTTATNTTGTGTAGGNISDSAPGNVSMCCSFRTNLTGRSYRGRNYVPGIPTGGITGNQIDPVYFDTVVASYNAMVADYIADDLPDAVWVVVSRYHLGAPRVAGVATPVEVAIATNYDLDSQRKRLNGRGV